MIRLYLDEKNETHDVLMSSPLRTQETLQDPRYPKLLTRQVDLSRGRQASQRSRCQRPSQTSGTSLLSRSLLLLLLSRQQLYRERLRLLLLLLLSLLLLLLLLGSL